MALLLFQLRIVFTVGLLLGPASVWAGGGEGPGPPGGAGARGARAALRGAPLRLPCPAPDPRTAAATKPKHSNMLNIGSAYSPQPARPEDRPSLDKTPLGILKEEDFYYDSNNDSDYLKGTREIELYSENGGIYDEDVDFAEPKKRDDEIFKKKQGGRQNKKKLEKKQLGSGGKRNKSPEAVAAPSEPSPSPVTFVWFHNGTEVSANESRRHVLADGTLFFKKFGSRRGQRAGLQDTGHYRCLAAGASGAMLSTAVTLAFASMAREFTSSPADTTVFEGDALQFPCQIQSNPAANITWEKNSAPLPDNKRYYILNSQSLLITNVQKEDAGDYRCVAVNSFLNKTRHSPPASVAVVKSSLPSYPLNFISENDDELSSDENSTSTDINTKNMSVYYGENVSLGCAVAGKPKPKVVWNFKSDSSETEAKEISSMEVLRILSIKEENSGLYTCIATNEQQSIQQAYRVSVLLAPYLKETPVSEHTPTAKTVRFNCSAGGSPPPRVVWYKDGRPLNITGRVKIKAQDKRPPELIVSDTISADKGVYQCIASNSVGEVSAWALLAVKTLNVPAPTLVRCHPVSKDTVRITWERPQLLFAVAYTVHFMLADGGEEHSQIMNMTSNIYNLSKLEPFRKYEFYTKSYTNLRGASDQSPHVICHGQGVDVYLSSVGNSSMRVAWKESAPGVKMWQVQWRLIGPNSTVYNVTLPPNASSYIVEDVHPLDKYEFRVLASPSDTWLSQDLSLILWSSAVNRTIYPFNSLEEDINQKHPDSDFNNWILSSLRPTGVVATATSPHSVNVIWRCDAAETTTDGYFFIVCYMQLPEGLDHGMSNFPMYREKCTDSYNSWLEITGLEPGTLYGFKVQAVMQNQQRKGPFSETVISRTKHQVSNSVTDVRWEVLDGGAVQISWTLSSVSSNPSDRDPSRAGKDTAKQPAAYTVYYTQDPLAPLPKWSAKNVTNTTQLELHDLNTEAVCYVMVSLSGEERGGVISIPPRAKVDLPAKDTSTDHHFGIALGVVLSVFCIAVCGSILLWQHRKIRRGQQGPPAPQIRTNRVARSDFECQELMGQPSHIDSKGGVVYINGVESDVALGGEVGEPLLNGHVRITENPRFSSKKPLPNGNCRPLLGKKSVPVFDGTLDVSRYEELPDVTAETILEGDITTDTSDQVCSEVLLDSTMFVGYKPDASMDKNCINPSPYNASDIANGVQLHVDRNSNSEVTNIKRVKECLNNDIIENDKVNILDTKSGAKNYLENEKEDSNPEKCILNKSGLNMKAENAKNNCSIDAVVTLDYRENGSTRRLAPALGPNG